MTTRVQLFADRFLVRAPDSPRAMDLATGTEVRLRLAVDGGPGDGAAWAQRCAQLCAAGDPRVRALIDFGSCGEYRRFEAWRWRDDDENREPDHVPIVPAAPSSAGSAIARVSQWLTDRDVNRPRAVAIWTNSPVDSAEMTLAVARLARLEGFVPFSLDSWRRWSECASSRSRCLICDQDPSWGWRSHLDSVLRSPRGHIVIFVGRHDVRGVPTLCSLNGGRRVRSGPSRAAESSAPYAAPAPPFIPDDRRREPAAWPVAAELAALRHRATEAIALIDAGRHVVGTRRLRDAIARLARRQDHLHAALGGIRLAEACVQRGQLKTARLALDEARVEASQCQHNDLIVRAAVVATELAIEEARVDLAEPIARTACAAAHGLDEPGESEAVALLARCLFWKGEYDNAAAVIDRLPREGVGAGSLIRLAIERSRIAVGQGDLSRAVGEAATASAKASEAAPELTGEAACALAFARLAVGDLDGAWRDVRSTRLAARLRHRSLLAVRAHLIGGEIHRRRGEKGAAIRLARRLQRLPHLPPLLAAQAALLHDLASGEDDDRIVDVHVRRTGLTALRLFAPTSSSGGIDARGVRNILGLLECCHTADDEQRLLRDVCARVRAATHASGVWFYAPDPEGQLAVAGDGARVSERTATRVTMLGQAIRPHAIDGSVEGGVPVRYGGATVGALAASWSLGADAEARDAAPLMLAAAAVAAPALAAVVDRRKTPADWPDLVGVSPGIVAVREAIDRAATAPFPVLIEGESGSGKELVARALQRRSLRRDRPWCAVNCAAMPDDLVESELFGHARGAFTGALAERVGVFEAAHTGTLFLDEIGELSLRAQAKVLRTIQEGEVRRLGETTVRRVDVRVIAATNRDLRKEVAAGRFRLDLLYRLDVVRITVPPLRERREDIPILVERFWNELRERVSSRALLARDTVAALARYDWPGNVRELQNVLAALAVHSPSRGVVGCVALPAHIGGPVVSRVSRLEEARRAFEIDFVRAALARAGGRHAVAGAELGLTRQGFAKVLARLGLARGR